MTYAYQGEDGSWTEIGVNFSIGDIHYSSEWLANETPESLAEVGIYFIDESNDPTPGIRGNRHIEDRDGKPYWVYEMHPIIDPDQQQNRKIEIEKQMAAVFAKGFPPNHPKFAGELLQLRDNDDKTNWMEALRRYTKKLEDGKGENFEAYFRTEGNKTIVVSYRDAVTILEDMSDWAAEIVAHSWVLKDLNEAGRDFDLIIGWPTRTGYVETK